MTRPRPTHARGRARAALARRLAALVALVLGTAALAGATPSPSATPAAATGSAGYAGTAACAPCHERETRLWRDSHHDHAMELPTPKTVRGDFSGTTFAKDGVTTTFLRRGAQYVVRTDGPDGKLHDYPVKSTFGWDPLQQYLLELPGGRLQALSIAWDTRPKSEGGQRWFHLYPGEKIDHTDVLHWTGPAQNWNHMCAECHSTNLVKGYDAAHETFATTWSDLNVGCEACHGPAAAHVRWAEDAKAGKAQASADPLRGLAFRLRDDSGGTWSIAPGASIAQRSKPPSSDAQIETCGRCHSRRAQLWGELVHGEPLAQTHRVALLDDGLYEADGQIRDEVYEYGSFLQSRMHAAGVRCSDCHDPHALTLRAPGNAVCTQCHLATTYDVPAHHHHAKDTKAARCVSCHMPERVYMGIDARHDHGFRVPRPDLSHALGTPNACTDCHGKESARWASEALDRWYGKDRTRRPHFAEALHAGRSGNPDAGVKLARVARDRGMPAIARATAVELLAAHAGPDTPAALRESLRDPDPLVRRAAAAAIESIDPADRVAIAGPLLQDPIRTVRLEALGSLLDAPASSLGAAQRAAVEQVVAESRAVQRLNADRADAQVNLGTLEARLGNDAAARAAFATAIRLQPVYAPAYVNLAELERRAGDEPAAEAALRRGIAAAPDVAELHHALGLVLIRRNVKSEALPELARAATLAPDNARYAYVYGVALHDLGQPQKARQVLEEALQRHPASPEILSALIGYAGSADREAALRWAIRLYDVTGDPRVRAMVEQLRAGPPEQR